MPHLFPDWNEVAQWEENKQGKDLKSGKYNESIEFNKKYFKMAVCSKISNGIKNKWTVAPGLIVVARIANKDFYISWTVVVNAKMNVLQNEHASYAPFYNEETNLKASQKINTITRNA